MEKLVIIDSCMREESRTHKILDAAVEVLSTRYEIKTFEVNKLGLSPVSPEMLAERSRGIVPESTVNVARTIAEADRLVIAAPFWDMSFPAVLKAFFENMSLFGVTFTDNGKTCTGLCNCKKVMYITTRGMNIHTGDPRDQGTSYLKALSTLWGLGDVITIAAENLDYMYEDEANAKVASTATLARALSQEF